jgi:hypothetical protein
MRTITRRLLNLEKVFAPDVQSETTWGEMARVRDELLRLAEQQDKASVAQLKEELDALGPRGLWLEAARHHLRDNGFVQSASESFAETMARTLGIGVYELRVWMEQGRVGEALFNQT